MVSARILGYIGILSFLIAWLCIALAIVISNCFDWRENALSDLGDWVTACGGIKQCIDSCNRLSESVFNYGLILSGILFALTAIGLVGKGKIYPYVLTATAISLSLIGVFPERFRPHHYIFSVMFFLLLLISMIIYTIVEAKGKIRYLSLILIVIGILGVLTYIFIENDIVHGLGVSIPETMIALPGSLWAVMVIYMKLFKRS
ncbi:MAG: hypothetical protein DRO40_04565 [Thermoprotei archaeon]|nr:MAG: hypothetical protein DRO40_04565 [Thermoprotei archaeon]